MWVGDRICFVKRIITLHVWVHKDLALLKKRLKLFWVCIWLNPPKTKVIVDVYSNTNSDVIDLVAGNERLEIVDQFLWYILSLVKVWNGEKE